MIANLFLHHFDDARLAELFRMIAGRTRLVHRHRAAPRGLAVVLQPAVWAINCNSVTRHDATVSVRAGFVRDEFSALWPDGETGN